MFKMDLSKFKKVGEDKTHTTLASPEGHSFKIAHQALKPEMRKQIKAIPMADGGSVAEPNKQNAAAMQKGATSSGVPSASEAWSNIKSGLGFAQADGGETPDPQADDSGDAGKAVTININPSMPPDSSPLVNPNPGSIAAANGVHPQNPVDAEAEHSIIPPEQIAQMQQEAAQQQSAAPNAPAAQAPSIAPPQSTGSLQAATEGQKSDLLGSGLENQMKAIDLTRQAQEQMGQGQAAALNNTVQSQQHVAKLYEDNLAQLNQERQGFIQDLQNQHIDPNHYLNSQGVGDRIKTAIGLILGGMGGAVTNQENPALKFLNAQIDRDIQAQQSNMGRSKSLLDANMHQFGNLRDATDMTRVMQMDIVANQLKQAAANAATPMAKANALQAAGALEMQAAPMFQQMAMRRALLQGNQQGGAQGVDPAAFVPSVVPPEHQKDVYKEINQAQLANKNRVPVMQAFEDASKENTVLRTGAGKLRTPASMSTLRNLLLPLIHDNEGKVSEFEQHSIEDLFPQPGDTDSKIAAKKQGLEAFLRTKMNAPTAKAYGIDLNNFQSTTTDPVARLSPQQQSFAKWAQENPKDPRSAQILKKLGIQ